MENAEKWLIVDCRAKLKIDSCHPMTMTLPDDGNEYECGCVVYSSFVKMNAVVEVVFTKGIISALGFANGTCFKHLKHCKDGKIKSTCISNFNCRSMEELWMTLELYGGYIFDSPFDVTQGKSDER